MRKITILILLATLANVSMAQTNTTVTKATTDSIYKKVWLLHGNQLTNPSKDFIGTTDNQRLVFRTNNIERMTISNSGYLGLNTANPSRLFYLQNVNPQDNAEVIVNQVKGSILGAYLTLDNRSNGGKSWSVGSTGPLNSPQVNGALEFYEYGYGTRMILDSAGRLGVGIGNGKLPTASLHVKGSVRLDGLKNDNTLTRILATDEKGNLAWRDIATIGSSSSGWSLTGNSGTNSTTNFIGTTDYQNLAFRVNNTERLTILTNGYTGINNPSPSKLLTVQGANTDDNAEILVKQTTGSALGAYLTLDNTANGGKWWSIGSTGSLNSPQVYGALEFYEFGFGTRMILDADGKLGIGIGNGALPTANLHVKGTVRLEDISEGSGSMLVIDNDGNVHKASTVMPTQQSTDLANQVSDLKKLVSLMQTQIENLSAQISTINVSSLSSNRVVISNKAELNILPNPSKGNTTFQYSLTDANKSYFIKVYDLNGRIIKTLSISRGQLAGTLHISAGELKSGVYGVSLLSQTEVLQNKFLIID